MFFPAYLTADGDVVLAGHVADESIRTALVDATGGELIGLDQRDAVRAE